MRNCIIRLFSSLYYSELIVNLFNQKMRYLASMHAYIQETFDITWQFNLPAALHKLSPINDNAPPLNIIYFGWRYSHNTFRLPSFNLGPCLSHHSVPPRMPQKYSSHDERPSAAATCSAYVGGRGSPQGNTAHSAAAVRRTVTNDGRRAPLALSLAVKYFHSVLISRRFSLVTK